MADPRAPWPPPSWEHRRPAYGRPTQTPKSIFIAPPTNFGFTDEVETHSSVVLQHSPPRPHRLGEAGSLAEAAAAAPAAAPPFTREPSRTRSESVFTSITDRIPQHHPHFATSSTPYGSAPYGYGHSAERQRRVLYDGGKAYRHDDDEDRLWDPQSFESPPSVAMQRDYRYGLALAQSRTPPPPQPHAEASSARAGRPVAVETRDDGCQTSGFVLVAPSPVQRLAQEAADREKWSEEFRRKWSAVSTHYGRVIHVAESASPPRARRLSPPRNASALLVGSGPTPASEERLRSVPSPVPVASREHVWPKQSWSPSTEQPDDVPL